MADSSESPFSRDLVITDPVSAAKVEAFNAVAAVKLRHPDKRTPDLLVRAAYLQSRAGDLAIAANLELLDATPAGQSGSS